MQIVCTASYSFRVLRNAGTRLQMVHFIGDTGMVICYETIIFDVNLQTLNLAMDCLCVTLSKRIN